jgi:hypothetical protein
VSQNPFCEALLTHDGLELSCARCEMRWDVTDPFPPSCQFESNQDDEAQPQ